MPSPHWKPANSDQDDSRLSDSDSEGVNMSTCKDTFVTTKTATGGCMPARRFEETNGRMKIRCTNFDATHSILGSSLALYSEKANGYTTLAKNT